MPPCRVENDIEKYMTNVVIVFNEHFNYSDINTETIHSEKHTEPQCVA